MKKNSNKKRKLKLIVANPKSKEYFDKKIDEINLIFKRLYQPSKDEVQK